MLNLSAKRLKPANVGDNILVPVPDIDRGRADFRNVKGVIIKCGNDGIYTIGTSHGILRQQYATTVGAFLEETEVQENVISLREVARKESLGSGQGSRSCTCLTGCSNAMYVVDKQIVCALVNVTGSATALLILAKLCYFYNI